MCGHNTGGGFIIMAMALQFIICGAGRVCEENSQNAKTVPVVLNVVDVTLVQKVNGGMFRDHFELV